MSHSSLDYRLRFVCVICSLLLVALGSVAAQEPQAAVAPRELSLAEYMDLVLDRNESLQVRLLEIKISHKRLKSESGVWEPELVLGYDKVYNKRENTAEQRRSTGVPIFWEDNDYYTSGIESLVPTGAKVHLGYTLRDLRNNLQTPPRGTISTNAPGEEYQSFAGISVTQPLLKNAWFSATMANLRLASLVGEGAFQEYRRQLMIVVTTAEAAYWNLFLAQEQVQFLRESVKVAESLVHDDEEKHKAGRGTELEVLEARSGLALRRTKLAEADQKYFETAAQVAGLMSQLVNDTLPVVRAKDLPKATEAPDYVESGQVAFRLNPDYLGQLSKLDQEHIRVAYAKNQRLPQLDLKGSYGLNGLGSNPGESWEDIEHAGFPSWSVGVELHIPLAGGIKGRNDLSAARMRKEQALLMLQDTEHQMLNSITMALRKLRTSASSVHDYEQIAAYNQDLLDTELKRLEAGKVDSRRVLEVDAALLESKVAVIDSKVQSERARLELQLAQGSSLRQRGLDFTRKQLEEDTLTRLRKAGASEASIQRLRDQPSEGTQFREVSIGNPQQLSGSAPLKQP